jgi:mono/diheme cytochrome c family protein/glucose/arabinose dehydrogenase
MPFSRLLSALGLLAVGAMTGLGYQASPANRPWPPGVQPIGPESPPLSPEAALKTFSMPPGYRLELVASEPLVQEPVAFDWDLEGRLWVVEMPGWMPDITAATEHDPIGRVVVLRDTNRDGRMDERHVFADGLILARSLKVLDRGVLVAEPPNVWLMRDSNGDLRMDTKELVTDQYGRRDVDPQNNANGFDWALDNRMYSAGQSDVQLRLKDGAFEVQKTLRRGEWGITHDDAGRIYRNTNESALHVDLVPTSYYARHPNLVRTRGSYERLSDGNYELNTVWPVRPNPGTNRAYQAGIDRPDGSLARFTSVCAPLVYRGDRLPSDVYGNVFVAEPAANLVSRIVLQDDDGGVAARKAYERGEFLASTDERFRPVYFANAPDGTLYLADLYRGIIEHRISITMYLRDQIMERKLEQPTGLGRIYRVVHESTRRDTTTPALSAASPARLVETLSHPNGWWRDTAQRLLVERNERAAIPALARLAETTSDWRIRLHALWTLDGLDAIQPAMVISALGDPSSHVRVSAVRLAERWLGGSTPSIDAEVMKRLEDPDPAVRRQLAATIGAMARDRREAAAVAVLDRHGDDPIVVDAAISSLEGSEASVLDRLLQAGDTATPPRDAAVTTLAATIVRNADDRHVQRVLAWIAEEARIPWQRSALLRGAEAALLNAALPGTASGRRGAPPAGPMPCPTCPGGRAGPGGAYAFPRPAGGPTARGRGTGPVLRLPQEPTALSGLAARGDALGTRAASVLARISWPGKSGGAEPVAPLNADEQRRFEAGREVYRNVCQACHQPDGRGQEKVAPGLGGSALTLAAAEIPVRILLNGKEGPVGLMPPIGSAFTDEQVASVLTFVRREWGNEGSPVDAATVRAVRAQTAGRTRPWTHDELVAMAAKP